MLALFQESCSKQFLDQITEADCQQFIRFLRKRYDSAKGARTVYNVFQGLNTFLRANKVFIAGALLGKLDYDEKVVDAYTPAELNALFAACDADDKLVWEYFLWTGCREGEVAHAEWCDLDFKKNVLHVQPKARPQLESEGPRGSVRARASGCDGETGSTQGQGRSDRADLPERAGQTAGPLSPHA
jgi:integrase